MHNITKCFVMLHVTCRKQLESELLPHIHKSVELLCQYRDDKLSHLQSPSTLKVAASSYCSHLFVALVMLHVTQCVLIFWL